MVTDLAMKPAANAAPLHTAARRRLKAMMPEPKPHEVVLRPLGSRASLAALSSGVSRDLIHTSRSANWVEAVMADAKAADWKTRLDKMQGERRSDDDENVLEMHLPIHRRFQIVLFEAVCSTPGFPRLDPAQINGSGIVLRRKSVDYPGQHEAWTKQDGKRVGWKVAPDNPHYDPDPAQRRNGHRANAAIRAMIAERDPDKANASEEIVALHVAPPDVCAARGKTILFGLIPVASTETEDEMAPALNYGTLQDEDRREMIGHLSIFLKERVARVLPRAGTAIQVSWADPSSEGASDPDLHQFMTFLRQLSSELNVFSNKPAVEGLADELRSIRLPIALDGSGQVAASTEAFAFLKNASDILLGGNKDIALTMPLEWPAVSQAQSDRLCSASLDCLTESFAAANTQRPKFNGRKWRYAVKGFVRTRGHGDCPDRIHWSGYSEPFRILEWWEGDGPNTRISLPSMDQLRKMKPNVTFAVPPSISSILQGDMKKLGKGEEPGRGMEIGWLCSFSIPIITLCAFIVLHIFLSLLDFIFRWMMWIKICVPIPKSKQEA